jgi:hypothetical protein
MSLLTQIPPLAEKIGETISGLSVNYRHSPIVAGHAIGTAGPTAGDRAPDAAVWRADGTGSLRLYDLFAEHRHHLLLCGNLPEAVLSKLPRYPESYLAVHRIAVGRRAGRPDHATGRIQKSVLARDLNVAPREGTPVPVAAAGFG